MTGASVNGGAADSRAPRALVPSWHVAEHDCLGAGGAHLSDLELCASLEDRVALLVPALNEAPSLPELLDRMPASVCGVPAVTVVVDDGSSDDTAQVALDGGALVARLHVNQGGGAALRVGYALALRGGARVVVTLDADGQHRPEEIEIVAGPVLRGEADFCQGSRTLGHAEPGTFARELGIAFFNRVVRTLTGTVVTDCSNGFRAIRTDLLAELDLREPQFHAAESLIEALTRGLAYSEAPISVLRRAHGDSKKPRTVRYGVGFCAAIVHAWRRSLTRRPRVAPASSAVIEPLLAGRREAATLGILAASGTAASERTGHERPRS